jgi:phage-related protein
MPQVTFPIVKDVVACVGAGYPSVQFDWPSIDMPGMPNLLRSTIQAVITVQLQFVTFIQSWVEKIKKNAAEFANFLKELLNFPDKVIKELIKNFMAQFKLPDIQKMITDWLSSVGVSSLSLRVPDITTMLTNIVKKIVIKVQDVKAALASEISSFLNPIKNAIGSAVNATAAAVTEVRNRITSVTNAIMAWINKYVSMLTFFISIPALLLKAIIDFLKKGATSVVQALTNLMKSIIQTFKNMVMSALHVLGLDVELPHLSMPPMLKLVICLLKALTDIILGFPGNVLSVNKLPALLPKTSA